MAVKKHNFLRTSPAEARNTLIRMPAEMKRDGPGVETRAAGQVQMPRNLLSLKYTSRPTHATNKAQSERAGRARAADTIYTAGFTVRCGVRERAVSILKQIHETHQAVCYLLLSEYCIQLICDI